MFSFVLSGRRHDVWPRGIKHFFIFSAVGFWGVSAWYFLAVYTEITPTKSLCFSCENLGSSLQVAQNYCDQKWAARQAPCLVTMLKGLNEIVCIVLQDQLDLLLLNKKIANTYYCNGEDQFLLFIPFSWPQTTICPNTLSSVVSIHLFYCSRSSRSLSTLEL